MLRKFIVSNSMPTVWLLAATDLILLSTDDDIGVKSWVIQFTSELFTVNNLQVCINISQYKVNFFFSTLTPSKIAMGTT